MKFQTILAISMSTGLMATGCSYEPSGNEPPTLEELTPPEEPPSQAEIDRLIDGAMREAARGAVRKPKRGTTRLSEWLEEYASGAIDTTGPTGGRHCQDVTSFDWDWDNDVLCTRIDGTAFYTSYEGANRFLAGQ